MDETNQPPVTEKPVAQMVTGYQWGSDLSYIGTYQFPENLDDAPLHLPPKTTLKAPPTGLPPGKEAAFDEVADSWVVRDEDLSWMDDVTRAAYLLMAERGAA